MSLRWDFLDALLNEPTLRDVAAVARAGAPIVLVGGAIRDALLGRRPEDVDLVVESDFDAAIDAIEAHRGRRPKDVGDPFQRTHRCRWRGVYVDISEAANGLEADLARRDFTINSLALRLPVPAAARDALIDPHGGVADLEAGLVRQVAATNIAADPVRVLRGPRYVGQLPGFRLDAETAESCRMAAAGLAEAAPERRSQEWIALLRSDGWHDATTLAWELGAGAVEFGPRRGRAGTEAWAQLESRGEAPSGDALAGRLAALLYDVAPGAAPGDLIEHLQERRWPRRLARTAARAASWTAERGLEPEQLADRAILDAEAAGIAGRLVRALGGGRTARLAEYAVRAEEPRWITGETLLSHGLEPGPRFGALLAEAARGQVTRLWSGRNEAVAWLSRQEIAADE
jgi:tRNA nucleotidyltransferase/poly(A) polymerase